jgi:hypothetical protein
VEPCLIVLLQGVDHDEETINPGGCCSGGDRASTDGDGDGQRSWFSTSSRIWSRARTIRCGGGARDIASVGRV